MSAVLLAGVVGGSVALGGQALLTATIRDAVRDEQTDEALARIAEAERQTLAIMVEISEARARREVQLERLIEAMKRGQ